jgi:hypothetical protein
VAVSVGSTEAVGVQVGSNPRGVIVTVGGGGIGVLGGKGFNDEYGLLITLKK